ncbi:dipeptide/oligopeptide/nickel ABC transporter permease/ATP-binding protein [Brachybacterium sp. J153]|uniref:dipeptide/oligopeptide/nickel ABC transporter permease/ATP-binding protein n=1 Tax=Brachybacterium sp. J153 TaxID=3116488 RepID=UPI002E7861F8|nr:dipeptide/oligopeptide/nickel ABC transporter permease/ATP-binding protein [Brachybacterium sp. J153]MEE1618614.1 dipeptide/oligopeptide/nickel ABC transporter permease/ATP-binding protein [Brachybacterium sp. J153]
MSTAPVAGAPVSAAPASAATVRPSGLLRRVLKNPVGLVSFAVLVVVALLALLGGVLAPHDANQADARAILAEPSAEHLLGTDGSGHDILSRLLVATQISLGAALVAAIVALVIGVTAGLLAGYYKGWLDSVFSWVTALTMALPGMIVLLAARAVVGPSVWWSMVIFGVLMSPGFFRLVYASVSAVREELYVDAARVAGLTDARIISRHILGVVRAPIIIQSAMVLGIAIAIQSGLEFLGIGDPGTPTWGSMLKNGFDVMYRNPVTMAWPALAIGVTTVALTLFGNALRDELERSAARTTRRRSAASAVREQHPATIRREDDERAAARSGSALLEIEDLRIGYDLPDGSVKEVVRGIDLTVRRGEVHGLIGESGSGKTQTSFSVLGLLPAGGRLIGGSIRYDGQEIATADASRQSTVRGTKIAYIPQEPMSNLDPMFTIGSQLVEPLVKVVGLSKTDARAKALELLGTVGIPDPQRTSDAYPHQVSGGMVQRVLIAGAISMGPDLLIADEPTTALDVTIQAEVLDLIRDLQEQMEMAVLLVTHNFGVVADLCDRVSVMQNGLLVEAGPVRTIFRDPQHPYTRSLLDAMLDEDTVRPPLTERTAR